MFHYSILPFSRSLCEFSSVSFFLQFSIISLKGGKYTVVDCDLFSSVGVKSKGAGQHFSAKIKRSNIQIRIAEDFKIACAMLNVGVG